MSNTQIHVRGTEFPHACGAIQHADNDGAGTGNAIVIAGRFFAVDTTEAHRLDTEGVPFAYLHDKGGRIVTVPVN